MTTIAVLGALDTKGQEFAYLISRVRAHGHTPLVIDTSVIGEPAFPPDILSEEVIAAGGSSLQTLRERADRGYAMQVVAGGSAKVISQLYQDKRIDGILGMGGSGGTSVFAAAVRALPVGFPKVLISTMASGDTSGIVGVKDLVLYPSVVDIAGLNRFSTQILSNAAGAVCGMVESRERDGIQQMDESLDRPLIAVSMLGNTTQAVDIARTIFEAAGYEVLVFHAIGSGGRTMESLIADGLFAGVLDFTLTELASELLGTSMSAGPDRLNKAGEMGVPMIIVPGCLDFAIYHAHESIPEQFIKRNFYYWNPEATLIRVTPEESSVLGRQIADRVNNSLGPVAVFLPLRGLSLVDLKDKPFWCPDADQALFDTIRQNLRSDIPLVEMDCEINSPDFAAQTANMLLKFLKITN